MVAYTLNRKPFFISKYQLEHVEKVECFSITSCICKIKLIPVAAISKNEFSIVHSSSVNSKMSAFKDVSSKLI